MGAPAVCFCLDRPRALQAYWGQLLVAVSECWCPCLPAGPLALLPVRDGYSNVVWSTTPQHARQLEHSTPQELVRALNEVGSASRPCSSTVP